MSNKEQAKSYELKKVLNSNMCNYHLKHNLGTYFLTCQGFQGKIWNLTYFCLTYLTSSWSTWQFAGIFLSFVLSFSHLSFFLSFFLSLFLSFFLSFFQLEFFFSFFHFLRLKICALLDIYIGDCTNLTVKRSNTRTIFIQKLLNSVS